MTATAPSPKESDLFPMKINLKMFSVIKDAVGSKEMTIEVSPGMSLGDLLRELLFRYPKLKPHVKSIMFAVNRDFADLRTKLNEGDEVALMPPIGGG